VLGTDSAGRSRGCRCREFRCCYYTGTNLGSRRGFHSLVPVLLLYLCLPRFCAAPVIPGTANLFRSRAGRWLVVLPAGCAKRRWWLTMLRCWSRSTGARLRAKRHEFLVEQMKREGVASLRADGRRRGFWDGGRASPVFDGGRRRRLWLYSVGTGSELCLRAVVAEMDGKATLIQYRHSTYAKRCRYAAADALRDKKGTDRRVNHVHDC